MLAQTPVLTFGGGDHEYCHGQQLCGGGGRRGGGEVTWVSDMAGWRLSFRVDMLAVSSRVKTEQNRSFRMLVLAHLGSL